MWTLPPVSADLRARYLSEGHWTDETMATFLERGIERAPGLAFHVWSALHPFRGTLGGLLEQGRRLATSLRRHGIGPGDVVAYQVPNWAEAVVVLLAGFRLGAVLVPIVHFYGAREVEFILRQCGARALITVDRFGHATPLANLEGFRDDLDALEHVVVIGDGHGAPGPTLRGALAFEDLLDAAPLTEAPTIDPDLPAMVGYTSGTTADPKGVVHTHRSLLFEVRQLHTLEPAAGPSLSASPLAHMTGMLGALLLPIHRGHSIHLTDQWNPNEALRIMLEADVSSGSGATIFLTSLLDAPEFGPEHLARMKTVGLGGSPVPPAVGERAESLGICMFRSYGSTEHPSITGCPASAPSDKRIHTDGPPMPGVELRLVDPEDESEVGAGVPGEIWSRGPDLFAGYTDAALTASAVTPDGWYRTGDVGVVDADGYLTITDRVSDIIIRGGANLSAAEIEESLMTMPAVAECAVVAAPDARTGEHALAVIRPRDAGVALGLAQVQAHLAAQGLPKQKWVEEVRLVDEFPRTPSGKIRKVVLREQARRS